MPKGETMQHTDHHHAARKRTGRSHGRRAGAGPRTTTRPGESARQALRREAPSTVALLTDRADFHAMRSYATFAFDDHPDYLRHAHGLLRALTSRGTHVSVVRFDPVQYAAYCADTGQDPDRPRTRATYVAEVAAGGAAVPFHGQPVDHLLAQLDLATEQHTTWQHATTVLSRCADPDAAFDRAGEALTALLTSAGAGTHHVVCSVRLDIPLVAALHAERDRDGTLELADSDALLMCTLLAAGIATGAPGGVVLRTGRGTPGTPDRVRGWTLRDRWLQPLTEAQVFNAYCTDPHTGDPIPPEPGVAYRAGTPLPPPEG
jgi:hypothetical protein